MTTRFARCESIADLYVRNCRWKGQRPFFIDDQGDSASGDEALDQSLRFASALRDASLVPGDVVAFLCLGSVSHMVAWYGTFTGGYIAANLHTRNNSVPQIAEALQWLGAKFVVHDAEFTSAVAAAVQESGLPIQTLALDDGTSWNALLDAAGRWITRASGPIQSQWRPSFFHRAARESRRVSCIAKPPCWHVRLPVRHSWKASTGTTRS